MRKTEKFAKQWMPAMKKLLALFAISMLMCVTALSQERTVTGAVKDASGTGLPGVNVVVKGTSNGVITDLDGKFSIKVPGDEAVIAVSFIGYKTEEVTVGQQNTFAVTLNEDVKQVDEVVVVGYGVQKKKLVTGATVQVKSEDLTKNNVTRIESALQGLTPGMSIVKQSGQPGSNYNITIRGLGSVNGSEPLVLIDGVPGSMGSVNPSDIETVDVLKDAASAAIYGSRAGNGVILITTKKGKAGKMQISYDGYYGISNPWKKVDVLNAIQYMGIMNEQQRNDGRAPYFFAEDSTNNNVNTNWQDVVTNENAPQQSHYLAITGGNEYSTFSISLSQNKEEGIFDFESKSKYERLGFRINSDHKVKSYLRIGENLTYTHRDSKALGTGNQYNNFMRQVLSASPLIKPYDESVYDGYGRSRNNKVRGLGVPYDGQVNPIADMHYNYNGNTKNDDIVGNIYAELEPVKGLKVRSDFGGTLTYSYYSEFNDTFHLTPYTYNTLQNVKQNVYRNFGYNFDNTATYTKDIGAHNFLVMVGMNNQDNWFFNVIGERKGNLTASTPILNNVSSNLKLDTANGNFGKGDARISYFGRIAYNYNEMILFSASLRRDASSRFGANDRVGYFRAFSGGFVLTKLEMFSNLEWLNFLKLRASWGENGVEPNRSYMYLATVDATNKTYAFGSGISPNIVPNPALRWEASQQFDIGFESRFLNCLSFSFDYYQKTSKDWIIPVTVPGISGIAGINEKINPYKNAGKVTNSGVEFDLTYTKNYGDFGFELKANLSYNENKVNEVPDSIIHGSTSVLYNGSEEFCRVQKGMPMGFFWGYKTAGILQSQQETDDYNKLLKRQQAVPGDVRFVDTNEDGILDQKDKVMIGDPHPDIIFGFGASAFYKAWDFSMNISGQLGNQIVQCYRMQETAYGNYTTEILDRWRWTDANTNGIVDAGESNNSSRPRVTNGRETNKNWRNISDLYVYDGDFLRIKSINLGHDFKKSLLKNIPVGQLRLYVSATNILTITKYKGIDPEVGYGSYYDNSGNLTDAFASGIDMGFYPSAITYLVGVNVKF